MKLIDLSLIIQIFVLINPLSSFPALMSAYKNKYNVKKIAFSAVIIAFIIAIIISLVGPSLFRFFGITDDSFRIAGGIILLLLGLETVRSKEDKVEKYGKIDSLISIIATPLLTGPATIAFITLKTYEVGHVSIILDIFFAFILVAIVLFLFTLSISKVNMKVVDISSRIFGLFLTAVAIEMIAKGITGLLSI